MTNYFEDDKPTPWTLADVYADLCGRTDIPKLLNVGVYRVARWLQRRERIKCPYPILRISQTDIYSKQEWIDWFAAWNAKHQPKTKWTDDAQPHGAGQPFFTYSHD